MIAGAPHRAARPAADSVRSSCWPCRSFLAAGCYDRGMKWILGLVLVAGCGPVAPPVSAPLTHHAPQVAAERRIFRQLRVGTRQPATRTTFELVIDSDRASLFESDERERRALSMADADRGAHWTVAAQRTYRGTATVMSGALDLALASDGVQPLQLHCTPRSVVAAAPGALRVSSSTAVDHACGDRGAWDPPATTHVQALVCDSGVADADEEDDDDRLVFAAPPGLEYTTVNDDCVTHGGGLRIAR